MQSKVIEAFKIIVFILSAVIILYVVMISKAIKVAKTAKNDLGSYIAIGIVY